MDDLEKRIKGYEQERKDEQKRKEEDFANQIAPLLPLAILFCNEVGQDKVDVEQIKGLFNGEVANKYQALEGGIEGLEFIDYLAEFVSKETGSEVGDVVIVTNANEIGFDVIRLMNYFEHQFYLTSTQQVRLLDKLGFVIEEDEYLDDYARQTYDKLWEIYDIVRDELTTNGFSPNAMTNAYEQLFNIRYKDDNLRIEIAKLIENLKHI